MESISPIEAIYGDSVQFMKIQDRCIRPSMNRKIHIVLMVRRAHHTKMQFSNSHFGHGLFDPLIVTFQGQESILGQKNFDLERSL